MYTIAALLILAGVLLDWYDPQPEMVKPAPAILLLIGNGIAITALLMSGLALIVDALA